MSNQAVGSVYQTIIDEVINSSRVDFEENGVEESVLEELRQGWQLKLSKLDVARFPWDPKPEQQPLAAVPVPPPTSVAPNHSQAQFSPQLPLPGVGVSGGQNGLKQEETGHIKQEPGVQAKLEPGAGPAAYQGYNGMDNKNSIAANRAAQHLEAQYGNRAAGSINAIQDRMGQQGQPQSQVPPPNQTPIPPPSHPQQPAQSQNQVPQAYRPQPPTNQNGQLNGSGAHANGQTDGAGDEDDFEGVLLQRGVSGDVQELGRVEIDRMLHEQIAAKAKSMEGGGLMVPLREATRHQTGARSNDKGKGVAQFDGGDDDDEEDPDDDLINSDLDDPEEENEDEEVDDEGLGHIMLCMYDKVQRVKNKWKCTLKDGVLTVNGKEYVFHKATGEYEW